MTLDHAVSVFNSFDVKPFNTDFVTLPHDASVKVFDILYIRGTSSANGHILTKVPLWQRKNYLEGQFDVRTHTHKVGVVQEVPGRIEFPYRREQASSATHIKEELDKVLSRRGEGLILKKSDSSYIPNSRLPVWLKVSATTLRGCAPGLRRAEHDS